MPSDREYFRRYEHEEQWQEAAAEEAEDRLDDMSIDEMASLLWGADDVATFRAKFEDALHEKMVQELADEGWTGGWIE